ncbi:IclR family transcriptional regulator [Domibacillus epiphyticus]|uniref:Glycerol operon regulatory protein n=1 Tax=Domibacillus epiphyticus TaxID=1714355 RepID=A0A1V2A4Q8_9BACI|nr:IclR family transcriptional regulator [Domibacillus epiphyticus]OMP65983.1 hypothetical protein BTO28_14420 [Domibacillus epiphyticus]
MGHTTSLENALLILKSFSINQPEMSVTNVADLLGVAKSTAHRLLSSLAAEGFVVKDHQTHLYSPGSSILALTTIINSQIHILNEAAPVLNMLVESTGENAHLAILEGLDIIYLQTIDGIYPSDDFIHIGRRHPAFCTSSGQAILAFSEEAANEAAQNLYPYTKKTIISAEKFSQRLLQIREKGYTVCEMEFREQITGIGAPVFNEKKKAIASVNITTDPKRAASPILQKRYISAVQEAAKQMTDIVTLRKRRIEDGRIRKR